MNRSAAVFLFGSVFAVDPALARAADGGAGALEAVALPAPPACTFSKKSWYDTVRLEVAPGIPYAEGAHLDEIEVTWPVATAPARVGVKAKVGRVTLEGLAAADQIPLRTLRSFVLGLVFLPPAVAFHWTEATVGEVEIEYTLSSSAMKVLDG